MERIPGMLIENEVDYCLDEIEQQAVLLCENHRTLGEALVGRRTGRVKC